MKGLLNPEALKPLTNVSAWLRHAEPARLAFENTKDRLDSPEFLLALTERNVIEQLKNLRTHPTVEAQMEQGNLKLHGWVYHIGEGTVSTYDPAKERFFPVRTVKSTKIKSGETDSGAFEGSAQA
jgi:carbonic anhydrase